MNFRIAVDIGGTFTDCIVTDSEGRRTASKALTNYTALEDGVLESVRVNAQSRGMTLEAMLRDTQQFIHGTTQATNALVMHSGVKVGLLTTRGHEDALRIGRVYSKIAGLTERDIIHSSRLAKPKALVERHLIIGLSERVDCEGDIIAPLRETEAITAIDRLVEAGVQAIAVSLLWSFVNDRHEQTLRRLIAERAPNMFVSISSDVAPVLGEYERTSTTVVNAYVGPRVNVYLERLEASLKKNGLSSPLQVMQASGGLTSVDDASNRPVVTLDSGPTGGILGSQALGRLYNEPNIICTDVGGTSFDVGLVLNGELPIDNEPIVARYSLRLPKVLVESIGSGGGSIAWIDEGGLLRVGPQSASSRPGPACYGLGGTEPTVTDADLVLGYLDPDAFLGGRMKLDKSLAHQALARVGKQLGLEPEELAIGIFRIINSQMADLIRKLTIEQGNDPRDAVLAAYGGAGPTHAAFYGHDIGARSIIIPSRSTAFSAEGMLECDISHSADASCAMQSPMTHSDIERMRATLAMLEKRVRDQFQTEGIHEASIELTRYLGVRFRRQVQTLLVPLDSGPVPENIGDILLQRFMARYSKQYGTGALLAGGGIEIDLHRVVGASRVKHSPLAADALGDTNPEGAVVSKRPVYFEPEGYVETPVYSGDLLRPGNEITGPAIIQRMGDSVVVPPGYRATLDTFYSLLLTQLPTSQPASKLVGATIGGHQ